MADMKTDPTTTTTTLVIGGMASVHAVRAVFTALGGVPGILSADVGLGTAVVRHDGRATHDALREAVELAGCELLGAKDTRRQLPVHQMDEGPGTG